MAVGPPVFVSPDPGAVMSEIRYRVVELVYAYFSEGGSFEYSFGSTHGKQSVTLHWDVGDFGSYEYTFVCGMLDSGDVMPFKAMIQCAGFDDWCTMDRSTAGVPNWTFSEVIAYWKAAVADLKAEMINTWSSGTPRATIYDTSDVISGEIRNDVAIIPVADNDGIYVSREAIYIGSAHEAGEESFYWKSNSSGMPGGVGGANFDSTRIAKAIEQLTLIPSEISFNHGATVFSIGGGLITE